MNTDRLLFWICIMVAVYFTLTSDTVAFFLVRESLRALFDITFGEVLNALAHVQR